MNRPSQSGESSAYRSLLVVATGENDSCGEDASWGCRFSETSELGDCETGGSPMVLRGPFYTAREIATRVRD